MAPLLWEILDQLLLFDACCMNFVQTESFPQINLYFNYRLILIWFEWKMKNMAFVPFTFKIRMLINRIITVRQLWL